LVTEVQAEFNAFRPSKIKQVMTTSKRSGHCDVCYNGCFNAIQQWLSKFFW